MKRIFFTMVTSLLILAGNAMAQDLLKLKNNLVSFEPVHWKVTLQEGGFGIKNETDRNEIVQVVHEKGSFGTYKLTGQEISCKANLDDESHQISTICILEPNETLSIDLDMAMLKSAEGTYQIAFEN